ncbi:branched-chain amino acid ABC transporter permease [Micromonospora arborensis]|uniref:branched-chain amino acid ABC transporter permease n=1 Tax=Micromonospora arborensis TaxID=2116518 RepID=UPI003406DF40
MTTGTATAGTAVPAHQTAPPAPGRPRPGLRAGLTGCIGLGALLLPALTDAYTVSLASTALVLAVLAMSTQLLVGVAGLPSFGQAAYLGVGAYTAALLAEAGLTLGPVQLVAAAAAGAVTAAATAPLVLRTRATAFLMTTFAVQSLTATIAARWSTVTGGDEGMHTPPVSVWPGTAPLTGAGYVYWYTLGCFLLLAAAVAVLMRSRLALILRGCADHETRMAALGHHVTAELAAGYTAAGALAGAGGALLVAVNRYVSPADLGFEIAAVALLAAAIGAGTMTGAVVGAIAVVAARDLVGGATGGHAPALLGALFLVVAYGRPLARHLTRLRRTPAEGKPS